VNIERKRTILAITAAVVPVTIPKVTDLERMTREYWVAVQRVRARR